MDEAACMAGNTHDQEIGLDPTGDRQDLTALVSGSLRTGASPTSS